ncbi:Hcp family type VI secretion system effector [Polyangium mundeleinium]|uniref:Hcp family type VI secretion system effector n=1 Tax=Polyangium mundeleinium TaxID=2995306 RepID=A0ABT5EP21_9BACT|nr:Hcp family type VI secretion system effector [Polyangium mundeleinium]MDC0743496.1 Hcp family type VI secretion system effector [Polyangium mundeleinium]
MALNAHLRIVAEKQGAILGSVTQKGREGSIQVIAAMHEIVSPRDPASGRPTGKRVHKPFVVTKVLDRSSPLLYSVLCNNENIKSFELQFYTPDKTGIEKQHYTVRLENANISSIIFRMPSTRSKIASQLPEREEISFTYQKIVWTWNEGGISADDDWETPR